MKPQRIGIVNMTRGSSPGERLWGWYGVGDDGFRIWWDVGIISGRIGVASE
jgi:hypothetical protein